MSKIIRNKGFIEYYMDGKTTPYRFNINEGIMYNLKGQPMKTAPAGYASLFRYSLPNDLVMQYMRYIKTYETSTSWSNMARFANYIALIDRLANIGITMRDFKWSSFPNYADLNFINDNFKAFTKYVKNYKRDRNECYMVFDFIEDYKAIKWIADLDVTLDEHFTMDDVSQLSDYFSIDRFNKPQRQYIAYQQKNHLFDLIPKHHLCSYMEWCDLLGWEYERGNFIKAYHNAKVNYEMHKAEFDNKRLTENQMKRKNALSFSLGNFEVIIPTTTEEFKAEGDAQRNCVYTSYLNSVIEGRTNVVFVRKNDEMEKSYITCEVRDGVIRQFLGYCNHYIDDAEAIAFKEAYQAHLSATWFE